MKIKYEKEDKAKYKKTKIVIRKPIRKNKVKISNEGVRMWSKDCLNNPAGYCMSIIINSNLDLEIYTDGKYIHLNQKQAKRLIKVLTKMIEEKQKTVGGTGKI